MDSDEQGAAIPWWIIFAAVACLTSASMILIMKYVGIRLLRKGASPADRIRTLALCSFGVLVLIGILGLCGGLLFASSSARGHACTYLLDKLREEPSLWVAVFSVAILVICTQLALFSSVNLAPNPGYAHIIVNLNVVVVLLVAALLFGSALSWVSGVGVALAIGGIVLVVQGA